MEHEITHVLKPEIRKNQDIHEFETTERCFIKELSNDNLDELVSIAQARVPPNTTTAWHRLNDITERYIVISGKGRVEIGDLSPVDVCEGSVVRIPPRTRQRITNTGTSDLIFFAICSPRFEEQYYEQLE